MLETGDARLTALLLASSFALAPVLAAGGEATSATRSSPTSLFVPVPEGGRPRLPAPLTKGVELYSWQESGTWCFSLLVGTNRTKETAEVRHPAAVLRSIAQLEARLAQLADGEHVTWIETPQFPRPPVSTREDLARYCRSLGIALD